MMQCWPMLSYFKMFSLNNRYVKLSGFPLAFLSNRQLSGGSIFQTVLPDLIWQTIGLIADKLSWYVAGFVRCMHVARIMIEMINSLINAGDGALMYERLMRWSDCHGGSVFCFCSDLLCLLVVLFLYVSSVWFSSVWDGFRGWSLEVAVFALIRMQMLVEVGKASFR